MYKLNVCAQLFIVRLRSQLLVAVMAVGSSSCSLPAQDLELEREMETYTHVAASSFGFNLKTGFVSLPTGFGKSLLHFTAQSDLVHRVDNISK